MLGSAGFSKDGGERGTCVAHPLWLLCTLLGWLSPHWALGVLRDPSRTHPSIPAEIHGALCFPPITTHHTADAGGLEVPLGAPDELGAPLGGRETSAQNGLCHVLGSLHLLLT